MMANLSITVIIFVVAHQQMLVSADLSKRARNELKAKIRDLPQLMQKIKTLYTTLPATNLKATKRRELAVYVLKNV